MCEETSRRGNEAHQLNSSYSISSLFSRVIKKYLPSSNVFSAFWNFFCGKKLIKLSLKHIYLPVRIFEYSWLFINFYCYAQNTKCIIRFFWLFSAKSPLHLSLNNYNSYSPVCKRALIHSIIIFLKLLYRLRLCQPDNILFPSSFTFADLNQ